MTMGSWQRNQWRRISIEAGKIWRSYQYRGSVKINSINQQRRSESAQRRQLGLAQRQRRQLWRQPICESRQRGWPISCGAGVSA